MIEPNWTGILWEARGYLDLDDSEPVPVDEVVAQAEANGYDERKVRKALREADKLEHADTDSGGMHVQLAEPAAPGESSGGEADSEDETPGSEAEESPEDDDYHVEIPEDRIADHYDRVRGVYERLASVGDYPTMGLDDLSGWYITRDEHDAQRLADGYDKRRRPASFSKDLDTVLGRVDRTIYGVTTYKNPEAFSRWKSARYNGANGYEYADGSNPTPESTDLRAVCAWGDIDLRDELKPQRGDLDPETKATAEATLEAYAEEFGKLVGGTDAVYGLDSVGGAYLFTAPEAAVAITEYVVENHGEEWAGRVQRELLDRSNEWLKEAQQRVESRVDGASDVIDPDWANNINRMYKAPLSIHKDHDAVVTPIDTDDVDYSITRLDDVSDELVAEGEIWADRFTAEEHTDRVGELVAELFDTEPSEWRDAIDEWVEAERDKADKRDELRNQQRQRDEDRDLDLSDYEITPRISDVENAIDDLNITNVADDTIVSHWTEDKRELTDRSGSDKKAIIPTWAGDYNSGNATYIDTEKGIFNDTDSGDHGTAVEMALLNADNVAWRVGAIANGSDWARGVQCLREMGYNIPVWTPDAEVVNGEKMPYWALRSAALALGVVEEDDFVERDSETGDVVEDDDEPEDTYLAFPPGAYAEAIAAVEDAGLKTGREPPTSDSDDESGRELLNLDVVVEPANALDAAAAIEPSDLKKDLPELERDDVADVAIAVALAEGDIDEPGEHPGDDRYTEAYYRARDVYGAPLPKYLDHSTLEQRADLCMAAVDRVKPEHILDAADSEVTVENPAGNAVAKVDPSWEDSESGERILAGYGRGFWCVEHETSFSAIQLVALEHGYIDTETEYPTGEAFKQSYRLLREEYGAPIPKWRATLLEHVAVLPSAVRVLDGGIGLNKSSREQAHKQIEALLRDAVTVRDRAQLITAVPGVGKTFSTAIIAADTPVLYLAGRNELKKQMEQYAAEIRNDEDREAEPTARHLPILAENQLDDDAIKEGVSAVRQRGRELLRNRGELYEVVEPFLDGDSQAEDDDSEHVEDDDEVELDRATCPTAEGDHGEEWRVAVQVARALGIKPAAIHQFDTVIFGDEMPCQKNGDCQYTEGWNAVRDSSEDILIGGAGHAFVDSATTHFSTDSNGDRIETPRAVVIDEFPGDEFVSGYASRYMDHATWLAESLVGIDNREDLLAADLNTDTWVQHWLDGDGDEVAAIGELIELLETGEQWIDALETAENLLDGGVDTTRLSSVSDREVRELLDRVTETPEELNDVLDELNDVHDTLSNDADRAYADGREDEAVIMYDLLDDLDEIKTGVGAVVGSGDGAVAGEIRDAADDLRIAGDLLELITDAADAIERGEDAAITDAARDALRGGRLGSRQLSVVASDGYAHPDAWALLAGAVADSEDSGVREVRTETFAFDTDSDTGSVFKRIQQNDATVAADKNHHGALVVDTPAFTDITGGKCPLVGLDATGRTALWRLAIGRDTQRRDIHDTDAERRRFLRENGLRVVQTTDNPLPYHGNPESDSKNFGEDLELLKTVAEKYSGGENAVDDKPPAVISTLKVIEYLGLDDSEHVDKAVNYENMKGSDELGEHQLAVVLGSCHYGDAKAEKWGLLAGEDAGRGNTKGDTLDYGSEVANEFLKHMRQDHTMQAILRAGRNDDDTLVFAHTSALRDDLPVEEEGVVLSAHSKGTLAVAEAAAEFTDSRFTAKEIAAEIRDDHRAVGLRQVQNVLGELRESGYLRVEHEGGPGEAFEYELDESPGLADVELPSGDIEATGDNEKTTNGVQYTWNFVSRADGDDDETLLPSSTPQIPASDAADRAVGDGEPPG